MDEFPHNFLARSNLLLEGVSDAQIKSLRAHGGLGLLRPGAYLQSSAMLGEFPEARHRLLVAASMPKLADDAVVSHQSAAVLHGIDLWNVNLKSAHVTRSKPTGGRHRTWTWTHAHPLDPAEIAMIDGLPVTSAARTVIDLACALGFEEGVVVADAALRQALVTEEELMEVFNNLGRRVGIGRARLTLAFANGLSQSVGESRSRVQMHRYRVPAPELQVSVRSDSGAEIACSDFGFRKHVTVGEFDGKMKYGRCLKPGQDPGEAVFKEKVREDAIRDRGVEVVRWIWPEIDRFDVVVGRLARAFKRGGH